MIDRDSYAPGGRGRDAFMSDARALLEMVTSYAAHDLALDRVMASSDAQRLVDSARRAIAASAVDELATLADLMADIAHDLGLPIEVDLRAARRLIDMTPCGSQQRRPPGPQSRRGYTVRPFGSAGVQVVAPPPARSVG